MTTGIQVNLWDDIVGQLPPNKLNFQSWQLWVTTVNLLRPQVSDAKAARVSTCELWPIWRPASQMSESNCCTHKWWNYCVLLVFESLLYSCTSSLMNTWMRVHKGKKTLRGPWSVIAKAISLVIRWYSYGNINKMLYSVWKCSCETIMTKNYRRGLSLFFPWFLF